MIIHLEEVGSTNDWLREHAAELSDGQWLRADRQTAGRGRRNRKWEGHAGNLAASCLVRLQPGEKRASDLGFVMAVALYQCVERLVDSGRLKLKWPNDLLLDGAKLSGILLERSGDEVIIGVGVNLAEAPAVAGRQTASLEGLMAPAEFCEMLAAVFQKWRQQWRREGFAAVRAQWLQIAHPAGTHLRVESGGVVTEGAFAGLADDGALLLRVDDGRVLTVHAGDVWEG